MLKAVMTDGNMAYCILGIENQSDIHYAAPVKNGLYDLMQYVLYRGRDMSVRSL